MPNQQIDMTGATMVSPGNGQNNNPPAIDMSQAIPNVDSPVQPTDLSQPGTFQSIVQTLAKPFLNLGASSATILEGAGEVAGNVGKTLGIPGSNQFEQNREQDISDLSKGVDVPYLGTATPWGSQLTPDNGGITPTNVAKTATGIAGDGLQIASWFLGNPESTIIPADKVAGTAAIDLSQGAINSTAGYFKGILNTIRSGLPFSLLQSASTGLNDVSQGKGKGTTITDSVMNLGGNIAGFAFMGGVTGLLRSYGLVALKSDAIQAANRDLVGVIPQVLNLTDDTLEHTTSALVNKIEQTHSELVQGMANVIDTKTDSSKLWKTITDKFTPYIKSLFADRDSQFMGLKTTNPEIKSEFSSTLEEIGKAKGYLDSLYPSENLSEEEISNLPPARQQLARAEAENNINADLAKSGLNKYVNKVTSVIGDGSNTVTHSQIQSLIDQGDLIAGETPQAQAKINSIQKLLRDDGIAGLRTNDQQANLDYFIKQLLVIPNIKNMIVKRLKG